MLDWSSRRLCLADGVALFGTVVSVPEIAEVELVRWGLNSYFPLNVTRVDVGVHGDPSLRDLEGSLVGEFDRVGKWLFAPVTRGGDRWATVSCHLGMTGQLLVDVDSSLGGLRHCHVTVYGADVQGVEHVVQYVDPRRFGHFALRPADFSPPVGPDLLDLGLSVSYLVERAARRRTSSVKSFLLDQHVLSGVGSYVADEACFAAGVSPLAHASSLSAGDWDALLTALRSVAERSLSLGGATMSDYRLVDGSAGSATSSFAVYGRSGEQCLVCRGVLQSDVTGGRSTVWCPTCQPLDNN